MNNEEVARSLREIATLLEIRGESPFQVRAYARAADRIESAEDAALLAREGRLTDLEGIGKAIADKIGYLLATGTVPLLDELRREIPPDVVELTRLPGLGPGRVRAARESLGVESVADLGAAIEDGRLADVRGFGPKTISDLRRAVAHWRRTRTLRLHRAARIDAEAIADSLLEVGAAEVAMAGDLARWLEVVDRIVIVASAPDPGGLVARATDRFAGADAEGASLRFESPGGLPVLVRAVLPERFGAVRAWETGSDAHRAALIAIAEGRGLTFTGEGLAREGEELATPDEASFHGLLGLAPIPPEAREGEGETEIAAAGPFPPLLEEGDLLGVVHVHTTWSDGTASLRAMALRARDLGFEYIGIADHSRSVGYAGGLSAERLLAQGDEIRALADELAPFRIFHGVESDILADGSLDYDDGVLERLDFVVASVHSRFGLGREEQTARLVAAVRNRFTTVLGHPSGRLLLSREPYDFDAEAVWRAAKEAGTAIELNAHEERLDVDWRWLGALRVLGVPIWIGADAHSPAGLEHHRLAIHIARKGRADRGGVWNALPAGEFVKRIRAKRR